MDKKYELTDETINHNGHTLHRIRLLRTIGDLEAGTLGGYIESEHNLSHEGDAFVFRKAKVYGDAIVCGDAKVLGEAEVSEKAKISGNALVGARVRIYGRAYVYGAAKVYGDAIVFGNAKVSGEAEVSGDAVISGNAKVYGDVYVHGVALICGDAKIRTCQDYIVFKNFWSSGRYFTWTRSNNKWKVGCFHGTGEELIAKAYKDSERSGREYERVVRYVESILADEAKDKAK